MPRIEDFLGENMDDPYTFVSGRGKCPPDQIHIINA